MSISSILDRKVDFSGKKIESSRIKIDSERAIILSFPTSRLVWNSSKYMISVKIMHLLSHILSRLVHMHHSPISISMGSCPDIGSSSELLVMNGIHFDSFRRMGSIYTTTNEQNGLSSLEISEIISNISPSVSVGSISWSM